MNGNQKYDSWEVERVKNLDIRGFIPGCSQKKAAQEVECPACGKKSFSVVHKGGKNFAYCHACKFTLAGPMEAVAHYGGMDIKGEWLGVLEETARQGGIVLMERERKAEEAVKSAARSTARSFCGQQLEGSGLTVEDVMATTVEGSQEVVRSPFRPGKVSENFTPDESGSDMLIYYYDLQGRPMTYVGKGTARPRPYVRVRWANPALHKSSDGKEMKYQTPAGASSRVYIPEKIRRMYKSRTHIDTLFLQEGEKKAEKASKHGMLSLGIQGINNFGSQESGLLQDIQEVVVRCSVANIVLVMDSDWNDLHRNIIVGDRADKRPNSFSRAVIKYRQYMKTFANMGLNMNIWWGHVNANERGDKGIDDLLCGTLLGREGELMDDIGRAMNTHDGRGRWVDIHKITEESDTKIRDFWKLNDVQAFYELHKEKLQAVETFKIGPIRYKSEEGKIVAMSRYSSASDIYMITQNSKGEERVEFNDVEAFRFLDANGFYRLRNSTEEASGFDYIRMDSGIIDRVASYEIRDFIREYIDTNCKDEKVLQFFKRKLSSIMADKQLENLAVKVDDFNNFKSGVQRTYYNNGQVEITSRGITPDQPISQVWRSRIVPRKFRRVEIIRNIEKKGEEFVIDFTEESSKCEFLQFLVNTSNNFYPAGGERELSGDEQAEWAHHIVNKVTTLGYLLTDYKYASERKAVVIQDHLMSEVGQSHGGAGKSVIGNAIGRIIPQFFIDGKQLKRDDEFLLSGVTKATRNIFTSHPQLSGK